jgi:hypothetical protein
MNLNELNNQYEAFKEEQIYQHLKWLGEKCQEMMIYVKENPNSTVEDEYFLTHIFIKPVLNPVGGNLGINFEFLFDDKAEEMYEFTFSTNDKYEHSLQTQIMNIEIVNKLDEIYTLFHDEEKKPLHLMLAQHLKNGVENGEEHTVSFSLTKNTIKSLLGEKMYARYEKEQLEKNALIKEPLNINTKLKL